MSTLDNQLGPATVKGVDSSEEFLIVWVTCSGSGNYAIDILNYGKFDLPCDQGENVPSRSSFKIAPMKTVDVTVQAKDQQRWAMTIQKSKTG